MLGRLKLYGQRLLIAGAKYISKREYQRRFFVRLNQHMVEYEYVFRQIAAHCPVTVLDVGTGTSALPHTIENCGCVVTAIDNIVDYWPQGLLNRHYHVIHDDISRTRLTEKFDMVTCIGVIQHVLEHDMAMKNMVGLLKPGGHLVVTTSYTDGEFCPDVYKLPDAAYRPAAGYACKSYCRADLDRWVQQTGARLSEIEYYDYWTGRFWTEGSQVLPPRRVAVEEKHQYACFVLEKPRA